MLAVVKEKTVELAQAHHAAWQTLRDAKVAASQASPTAASPATTPLEPATPGQRGALRVLLGQAGWPEERIMAHLHTEFECERLEDLSGVQAAQWLLELQRAARLAARPQKSDASLNGAKPGTGQN